MRTQAALAVVLASMLAGCAESEPPAPPVATTGIASATASNGVDERVAPPRMRTVFDEIQGIEAVRDPFQHEVEATPPIDPREAARRATVAFGDVEVGSLRVRGTASAGGAGHAIIADSNGHTRVVSPGQRIGVATRDKSGNLTEWTVDRIRNGDVVLAEVNAAFPTGKTFVLGGSS